MKNVIKCFFLLGFLTSFEVHAGLKFLDGDFFDSEIKAISKSCASELADYAGTEKGNVTYLLRIFSPYKGKLVTASEFSQILLDKFEDEIDNTAIGRPLGPCEYETGSKFYRLMFYSDYRFLDNLLGLVEEFSLGEKEEAKQLFLKGFKRFDRCCCCNKRSLNIMNPKELCAIL